MSVKQPQTLAGEVFVGGGVMGALMRSYDWSQTSLGAVQNWSQSFKTAVRIMLTSRQAMFVWWGDELINLYNDAYRAILGGKHPEALGQPASQVWREIWDQVGPRAQSAILNNEGTYDEALLLIMERNGYPEETYYTFSYSPVPGGEGESGGIICANTDVTEQIIGERQLALLKELGSRTIDARTFDKACTLSAISLATNLYDVPFGIIYLVDAEQQCAFLAGASGIEPDHSLVPQAIALDDTTWHFAEALKTQQPYLIAALDVPLSNLPTGAWQIPPHQLVIVPIAPSGNTGKAGILVAGLNPFRLFDDNYQRFLNLVAAQIAASIANAQAYEEERKRAEELVALDRAKTIFFSNVSHEFRTPLTLMLSPLEAVLAAEAVIPIEQRQQLELVYRNSLRLQKLVNTLLDFSRIEAGRVQAVFEPTDLAALTAELASVFRSAIEQANLQFIVACEPLSEPVYVDRGMWEKIMLNLLSNALKFTFCGEIAVRLQQKQRQIELTVRDTGIGIPAAELPRLFERFYRVEGAQGKTQEGSGIGLALVQELIRLHGGQIQVGSIEGEGTTFTLAIPMGTSHLPTDRIQATQTLASTALGAAPYVEEALRWLPDAETNEQTSSWQADLNSAASLPYTPTPDTPARILLADDNADMRDYVKRLLLNQGYEVETTADGLAALSVIQQHLPDLVLTDVMMPRLDGFGLLRECRSAPLTRELPIILLSARAGEEARVEGLEAGADDYLIKPFSARELLARVEASLKLAQLRRDATQREQALRLEAEAAQQRVETILSSINDGFYTLDRNWRYTYVNDRLCEIVAMERAQILDCSLWDLFPDLVGSDLDTEFRRSLHEQTPLQFENFYAAWNHWYEHRAYPSPDGLTILVTDITDRKQAEQAREQSFLQAQVAREQAETANRFKDEFLAVLSHELRSPLNPILGWSSLLRQGKLEADQVAQALEIIERNAKLQVQLINDLLDLSSILRGKLTLTVTPIDLSQIIAAALETVRLAAKAKDLQIQTVIPSAIGLVQGDAGRLQQVVWNLLSNAVKFTPVGGHITIRLDAVGTHAQIQVQDNGKGINPHFLPYVFEHFRQEDGATTRKFGGLGLGLAIVRQLIELHGGTVAVTSAGEGQGATFTVQIPLATRSMALPTQQPSNATHDLSGLQILVVDDDVDSRDYLAFVLEQANAIVTRVASGTEALQHMAQLTPDLVISDIGMPEMDGYMLLQHIRALAHGKTVPTIALTAYVGELNQQQALTAGFQMHLPKPVEPDDLVMAIAKLLKRDLNH